MTEVKTRKKRLISYPETIILRLDTFTYNWIAHLCNQIGVDKSEAVRRVLQEKAYNDPSYKEPREQKVF